jgi:hypothetical protein
VRDEEGDHGGDQGEDEDGGGDRCAERGSEALGLDGANLIPRSDSGLGLRRLALPVVLAILPLAEVPTRT